MHTEKSNKKRTEKAACINQVNQSADNTIVADLAFRKAVQLQAVVANEN
jgi:hypothetical protein